MENSMRFYHRLLASVSLAAALLATSGCATSSLESARDYPRLDIKRVDNIEFSPSDWPEQLAGDIIRPDNDLVYPAVVMIHGGGWTRRSRSDTDSLSVTVAERGYVVFNISYRFAPEYPFPAQIHDSQLATKWLRDNAASHGADPKRIAAWGYSSGAHLAAMLGVIGEGDALDSPHGGDKARVQAVVAGGIPAVLSKYKDSKLVNQFVGAKLADDPESYAAASPITHASAGDPPFYFYNGKLDFITPIGHAEEFKAALDAVGVDTEMYVHGYRAHLSMFFVGGDSIPTGIEFLKTRLARKPADQ
jgi:acetyl esterase/lipase